MPVASAPCRMLRLVAQRSRRRQAVPDRRARLPPLPGQLKARLRSQAPQPAVGPRREARGDGRPHSKTGDEDRHRDAEGVSGRSRIEASKRVTTCSEREAKPEMPIPNAANAKFAATRLVGLAAALLAGPEDLPSHGSRPCGRLAGLAARGTAGLAAPAGDLEIVRAAAASALKPTPTQVAPARPRKGRRTIQREARRVPHRPCSRRRAVPRRGPRHLRRAKPPRGRKRRPWRRQESRAARRLRGISERQTRRLQRRRHTQRPAGLTARNSNGRSSASTAIAISSAAYAREGARAFEPDADATASGRSNRQAAHEGGQHALAAAMPCPSCRLRSRVHATS